MKIATIGFGAAARYYVDLPTPYNLAVEQND
jgi:hypothetical protein